MAKGNEHITDLETMLQWYVAERRNEVKIALELWAANGDGGVSASKIIQLNEGIDAIEAAITHEKKLMGPTRAMVGSQVF